MAAKSPYQTFDVQHFEHWSRHYENSLQQRILFVPIHTHLLNLAATLPTPTSVLDVGCGTGRLLRAAAARWPHAMLNGVDPAEGMVTAAQHLTPGATIQRGLAEVLPLPDTSIDLVVSTMSFHHWGDQTAGVREIARVLRPGGHFILVDIAPPAVLAWFGALTGARAQSVAARRRIVTAAGLRIQHQQNLVYPAIVATVAVK